MSSTGTLVGIIKCSDGEKFMVYKNKDNNTYHLCINGIFIQVSDMANALTKIEIQYQRTVINHIYDENGIYISSTI